MVKRHAPKYVLALLLVLMFTLSLTSVTSAQQKRAQRPAAGERAELTNASASRLASNAVRLPDGRVQVIVSLSQQPAVIAFINAGGRASRANADLAAASQKALVLQEQANFVAQATALGGEVFSRTSYLTNSVTLRVNPSQLVALSRLAGVSRIDPDRILYREDTVSVPFIGSDEVWTGIGGGTGYTGAGTVVSVIDTGIDYIHTHFGGAGDYSVNPSDTDGSDTPGLFPAAFPIVAAGDPKVVGGYDYVGDDFDASGTLGSTTAVPDTDPIDCPIEEGGGHGTHVAGTAAGWGVSADGTTYEGALDNTIFTDFPEWTEAFRIGPGVAPEAALLAMRVFGCNGSTFSSLIAVAMDDSVSGEYGPVADVINMSLGSAYGTSDPAQLENIAVANASAAGTVVVMSAGNNGDFFFVSGSPGAANEGLAVASSVDLGNQGRGVSNDDTEDIFPAAYGASSPFIHDPLTAVMERPAVFNGCNAEAFAGFTAGRIALIDRGTCTFAEKQDAAFAAGAVGVIVANIATSPSPESLVTMAEATNPEYDLPTVHVGFTSGEALRASADGTNTATMDWTFAVFTTEVGDTLSSFSSRGPTRQNANSFKPDMSAPGNTILSAGAGTGTQTYNISGTSMASPHVAGAMALLKEAYPTWDVADLKALVLNTSVNPVAFSDTVDYGPQRVGTGRIDLVNAFSGQVIAYNTVNPAGVSVSFGFPEVVAGATLNETRTITLENKTATAATYDVSFTQGTDMVGVAIAVTETTVTVPANGTATVTVTLTGDPNVANVNTNSDATLATAFRHRITEEAGWVEFEATSGSEADLRVGVYAAPRVVSDMSGALALPSLDALSGATTVDMSGTGVSTGATANDITSIVTAYELAFTSPDEPGTPNNADIAYVGVTNDYAAVEEFGDGYVYFGIATHGYWNVLNEVEFDIYIDTDQDGDEDFIIFNTANSAAELDTYVVLFVDVNGLLGGAPGDLYFADVPNYFLGNQLETYLINTNVTFFPFPMQALIGNSAFDYWGYSFSARYEDPETELTLVADTFGSPESPLTYSPANAPYSFSDLSGQFGGPYSGPSAWADLDGFSVPVDFNLAGAGSAPDILLLHHHNGSGSRAEVVEVNTSITDPTDFALLTPPDGALVTDTAAVTAITWEAADALEYRFVLYKLSNNPRSNVGEVLDVQFTAAADEDPLTCDSTTGVCTLTVDASIQALLSDGFYSWTVQALGLEVVEAANGPFTFSVNTGDIELLVNNSFETPGASGGEAEGWSLKNATGDKRKEDPTKAYSGNAYIQFKGSAGENSKIQQNAHANDVFANVGVGEGDVLNASVWVNTTVEAPGKLTIKVTYDDATAGVGGNGKDKLVVDLAATGGVYQQFSGSLTSDGAITKAKFIVGFTGASGKMWVDDASLIRAAAVPAAGGGNSGRLPLPGEGGRGG